MWEPSLVCLDAHLPRPGWSGENLGLPTRQGTFTGEGGGERGRVGGKWEKGRRWIFLINRIKKKKKVFLKEKYHVLSFQVTIFVDF